MLPIFLQREVSGGQCLLVRDWHQWNFLCNPWRDKDIVIARSPCHLGLAGSVSPPHPPFGSTPRAKWFRDAVTWHKIMSRPHYCGMTARKTAQIHCGIKCVWASKDNALSPKRTACFVLHCLRACVWTLVRTRVCVWERESKSLHA